MEYRKVGTSYTNGMDMVVDRRTSVTIYKTLADSTTYTNTFVDQWRASLLGLEAGTQYEVRVTLTDPDGGGTVLTDTIFTWTETDLIPSTGATYYVSDATGNDTTGDGSVGNPWKTIQKAVDTVVAGDTILVKAGTYAENVVITTSGTSNNYITLRNYQSDLVTILPPVLTSSREDTGISTNADYIRIKGFRIVGGNTGIRAADDGYGCSNSTCTDFLRENQALGTSWTELDLTWNNKPALSSTKITELGPVVEGFIYTLDVTSAVTGNGQVAFALKPTSGNGALYDSTQVREPTRAFRDVPAAGGPRRDGAREVQRTAVGDAGLGDHPGHPQRKYRRDSSVQVLGDVEHGLRVDGRRLHQHELYLPLHDSFRFDRRERVFELRQMCGRRRERKHRRLPDLVRRCGT